LRIGSELISLSGGVMLPDRTPFSHRLLGEGGCKSAAPGDQREKEVTELQKFVVNFREFIATLTVPPHYGEASLCPRL
jgi:hypothetical protein